MLGHGDEQSESLPRKIEIFTGERVVAVSAGRAHSLALAADGSVWSWGRGYSGPLGHGDDEDQQLPKKIETFTGQRVVAVSAGGNHSLAATADGPVWSWGHGTFGKLGHGDEQHQLLPKKTEGLAGQRVVDVSAGLCHSLALTAEGDVWSWGVGWNGVLGHGDEQRHPLPKKMEAFAGQRVVAVSAAGGRSIARTADVAVFTWGKGDRGCLGHGEVLSNQSLPKKIEMWASRPPTPASSDGEGSSDGEDSDSDE